MQCLMKLDAPRKMSLANEQNSQDIVSPVGCLDDLNALEKLLVDDKHMQRFSAGMSFICGTSGKARGTDCCYKLIDYFFTRQFLTQCSWTGATRLSDGNVQEFAGEPSTSYEVPGKIPLKFFNKTRTLFLHLIIKADKDFSVIECEQFFKTVLKNSKQRVHAKCLTSKHKNRPKNLKYNVRKTNDENQQTEVTDENVANKDGQEGNINAM